MVLVMVRNGLNAAELQADASPASLQAELEPVSGQRTRLRVRWDRQEPETGEVTLRLGSYTRRVAVRQGSAP